MEIDPFDASFETGPMGEDSAGTNGFALVGVDPGRGLDASGPVVPPLPPLSALAAGADADAESKSGADARITQCCIRAYGTVQGAMFRQTVIRGAKKRGLRAGATNSAPGEGGEPSVTVTLEGKSKGVSQIVNVLRQSRPLNDWGAVAERIVDLEGKDYVAIEQHEVTTENVDNFDWNPSCQMYL
jgi:acylphosphatase